MNELAQILANNQSWSQEREAQDPGGFLRQSRIHAPRFLWIGCIDSRIAPEQLTGLGPGEMLVHRNIANLVRETDSSCSSVLAFAIDHLKVRHIMVVGHSRCGGVEAALQGQASGVLQEWLAPVCAVREQHREKLGSLPESARADHLSELSLRAQWSQLTALPKVQQAWQRGQSLAVHACFYSLDTGRLRVLDSRTA